MIATGLVTGVKLNGDIKYIHLPQSYEEDARANVTVNRFFFFMTVGEPRRPTY